MEKYKFKWRSVTHVNNFSIPVLTKNNAQINVNPAGVERRGGGAGKGGGI